MWHEARIQTAGTNSVEQQRPDFGWFVSSPSPKRREQRCESSLAEL